MTGRVTVVIPTIPPRRDLLMRALNSVWNQERPADAVSIAVDHHHEGAWSATPRSFTCPSTHGSGTGATPTRQECRTDGKGIMSRRRNSKTIRERKAAERARERQKDGDVRPYMVILAEERRREDLVIPLSLTRRAVNVFGPGGTL